jgi:hypothetical protein
VSGLSGREEALPLHDDADHPTPNSMTMKPKASAMMTIRALD